MKMARFELILSMAKRNKDNELYTEEREYMCFCKNPSDMDEITEKTNEIVYEEFEENMKDEEVAAALGYRTTEKGRKAGYKQLKNLKKQFKSRAEKILKTQDIFYGQNNSD